MNRGEPCKGGSRTVDGVEERMGRELTPCETKVLGYLTQGYSNKEIAEALSITPKTIKHHVTQILMKLGAKSRTHAVSIALRNGVTAQSTVEHKGTVTHENYTDDSETLSCFCGSNRWLVVKPDYLKCAQCGQLIIIVHSVGDIS